ncbi:hypothetical protein FRB94_011220 [Tulasnella sp. JGI-2019a]|nr:hypothetical protein FRB93_008718 [Tulasnella sp. JGI-2019a]KAG9009938.1 hypothetical protein FRB94_011220 [Tulasnella sp. JGI-2019a]KAG9035098.1 hypothetical protein FRB95_012117 [Tulasnella sp. JGI-2019a]
MAVLCIKKRDTRLKLRGLADMSNGVKTWLGGSPSATGGNVTEDGGGSEPATTPTSDTSSIALNYLQTSGGPKWGN